jgi:biopolymer transport protein ExbB/TolQ
LVVAIPATLAYNYFVRRWPLIEGALNNLIHPLLQRIAPRPFGAAMGEDGSG